MNTSTCRRCFLIPAALLAGLAFAHGRQNNQGIHAVTGTAVYYSDNMNGKAVALKGEKYDKRALTAATHHGFPLGSMVKVTNLENNKAVSVKVNDRMNPSSTQVIDLSRRAAEEINLVHAGHARVRVELISASK